MTDANSANTTTRNSEAVAAHPIPKALETPSREPALSNFRALQFGAIALAIIWLISALVASQQVINTGIANELERHQAKAYSEANFISQIVAQGLNSAKQLSLAIAQDTATVDLIAEMNNHSAQLKKMSFAERYEFLKANPTTQNVSMKFARIAEESELMAVFALDASGYCIATSDIPSENALQANCLGSNYTSRYYYQSARANGQGRQFAVGKRVPLPSLFFASRTQIDGKFGGAVATRVDARVLTDALKGLPNVSWVINNAGIVVSSNREQLLFHHLQQSGLQAPHGIALKTVYAQKHLQVVPLSRSDTYPESWPVWFLDNTPMVIAHAAIGDTDFQLWHAFPVADVLAQKSRAWYLAAAIIVLGLLIILLVERMVDFHQRRVAGLAALSRANRSLEDATKQLYTIATTDHLTQLFSRGYFLQRLEEELHRAKREQTPLALLELDIDDFKKINDTHGHPAGDAAIRHMADHCRHVVRASDLVGRIGGEEFAIALPNCSQSSAMQIAENIRHACDTLPLHYQGHEIKFTCSIGVTLLGDKANIEEMLNVVDQALYRAKHSGRNSVELIP